MFQVINEGIVRYFNLVIDMYNTTNDNQHY